MKVIILAAGVGKRLHPLTLNQPKCLVELFGKSILKWQIDVFNHFNITDITVVKGYMEEKINIPNLNHYVNKKFQDTNIVEVGLLYTEGRRSLPEQPYFQLKLL